MTAPPTHVEAEALHPEEALEEGDPGLEEGETIIAAQFLKTYKAV